MIEIFMPPPLPNKCLQLVKSVLGGDFAPPPLHLEKGLNISDPHLVFGY